MNSTKILLFIAAWVVVIITSDDLLSEQLVESSHAQLNAADKLDAFIADEYAPAYDSLEALRQDYPGFAVAFAPAPKRGSAFLHYLGVEDTISTFTAQLPDMRITVDMQGKVLSREPCGVTPGGCVVAKPASTEFGLVTEMYFQPSRNARRQPALDHAAFWEGIGQVETHAHCFWAYTPDITRDHLTLQSTLNRYDPFEPRQRYGFYAVEFNFVLEGERAPQPPEHYARFTRIPRAEFFARKGCRHLAGD